MMINLSFSLDIFDLFSEKIFSEFIFFHSHSDFISNSNIIENNGM